MLVAIPAGAAIAGILGMFIVVPILGVVAVTWRTVLSVIGLRRRESDAAAVAAAQQAPPSPDVGTAARARRARARGALRRAVTQPNRGPACSEPRRHSRPTWRSRRASMSGKMGR